MIVLHAVVARDAAAVAPELRHHDAGQVSVLYEEVADPPGRDSEDVVEHGRRVVQLAEHVPLLPMRYGTTVPDLERLRAVAEERAEAWSRRLAELAGRCELVVHLELSPVPAPVAVSGRDYLKARIEDVRRHDRAVDDARMLVGRWTQEVRLLVDGRRLAVLLRREDADHARAALESWGRIRDDLEVTVTGPWPPFSFCEEVERP